VEEALRAAGSGWQKARDLLIETRLAQVKEYGLTEPQLAYYRAAIGDLLPTVAPDAPALHNAFGTDLSRARNALTREDGPTGEYIADLLARSVTSRDDTYLRTIGAYNRARTGGGPVSPPLSQRGMQDGWSRALLDLIALPESGGNYNAWYRNAGQNHANLASLSIDQVRALQADLVRTDGGSAIGRYQLLSDTLDGLVERLGLNGDERFTPELQDRMALELAQDVGMETWLRGQLTDKEFARNLAQIWAGLPKDGSNQSFYAGVQGNRATADWDTMLLSLRAIRDARGL
jgi:conjugal transfer mating pair stabilization protein TraG